MRKLTTIEFIKRAKTIHGEQYDYSLVDYKTSHQKIVIVCDEHGKFDQKPNSHLSGCGCPICGGRDIVNKEKFVQRSRKIHQNTYEYGSVVYGGYNEKVEIICLEHGSFYQTPFSHLIRKTGCPNCKESKGEKKIREVLNMKNILFEREKRFADCRDKYPLLFDFYLPTKNILIEFDGKQHYEAIDFFGGADKLTSLKKRDNIKNEYAKKHNIRLIRILYSELDQIENILNNTI